MNLLAAIILAFLRLFEVDEPEPIAIPEDIMELRAEISAIEHFMYDAQLSGSFWYDTLEARREHTRLVNLLDKRMGL